MSAVLQLDEVSENVIDGVRTLTSREITVAPEDPFSRDASEVSNMQGISPAFKGNVTRKMNKMRRGIGSASSRQINEDDYLTQYQVFDVMEPPYNMDVLAKLYEASSPHYAAINAKVSNIVGLGFKFVESNKSKRNFETIDDAEKTKKIRLKLEVFKDNLLNQIDEMNEEDTFTETLVKVWRDYEVTGNGYLEIGRNLDGTIGYIGHAPSKTMRVRRVRDGFVQVSGSKTQFFANFGHGGQGSKVINPIDSTDSTPNEMIHFKRYSPTSGYYGVPDIVAAQQAVAGNEFASRYNLDYFENKAVPRHIIILKGAKLGSKSEEDLLGFFSQLKGQNHRSIYIPLPGDTVDNKVSLEIQPVETGTQDSSFANYRKANIADILMAHRVPITKINVSEGASLAVAKDADKTFKEQVCGPEQRILEKKLSRVFRELTDALDFKLNEMTLTDENTQSQIDERRRKTGTETANEQRIARGQAAIDGGDELYDMNAKAKAAGDSAAPATSRERDATRSANATDSAGEARNAAGEGRTTP